MSKIKGILKIAETPRRARMSTTAETGERPTMALYPNYTKYSREVGQSRETNNRRKFRCR
jgi:hypothetical protein